MCALFRNRFRSGSFRYKGFNYSNPGSYFITICTKDNLNYFGCIINGEVFLSELGKVANDYWKCIPDHFPNVELDKYIIMPNHIHGIIILKSDCRAVACNGRTIKCNDNLGKTDCRAGECNGHPSKNELMSRISPIAGSVGSIIRSFKSAVSKEAHRINPDFIWHNRYYDHIIRTNRELKRIRQYIQENPTRSTGKYNALLH